MYFSILSIIKLSGLNSTFNFKKIDPDKITFHIQQPDSEIVSKAKVISARIMKEFNSIFSNFLAKISVTV